MTHATGRLRSRSRDAVLTLTVPVAVYSALKDIEK